MKKGTMRDARVVIDMEKTKENLKRLRKDAGMSVKEVSEKLGMESVQSIYDWEGERKKLPRLENAIALTRLYGVTLEELYVYKPLEDMNWEKKV